MSQLRQHLQAHYDGVNSNDLDAATATYAHDVKFTSPMGDVEGVEAFRAFGQAFFDAAPDGHLEVIRTYEDGNVIVCEGEFSGTQTGALVGPAGEIPPSNRAFRFPYVDIMEIVDDKVVRHVNYWDTATFMAQIGVGSA